jgi:hypothetical protein
MKVESAKQNFADSFVNAFVNAGFGTDSLLMNDKGEILFYFKRIAFFIFT